MRYEPMLIQPVIGVAVVQSSIPHRLGIFSQLLLSGITALTLVACSGNLPLRFGETLCDSSNPCPAGFRCADSICVVDNTPDIDSSDNDIPFTEDWDAPQGDSDINVPSNFCRTDSQCQDGYLCLKGSCTQAPCSNVTCNDGEACSFTCIPTATACDGVECAENLEYCVDGSCIPTCQEDVCKTRGCLDYATNPDCQDFDGDGKHSCGANPVTGVQSLCVGGRCSEVRVYGGLNCDAFCGEGYKCSVGCGSTNPCDNNPCALGWNCVANGSTATCVRNECSGLTCGDGETCISGNCIDTCANINCAAGGRLCANGNVCCGDVGARACCANSTDLCRDGECLPACTKADAGASCAQNEECVGNDCFCKIDNATQKCANGSCCIGDGSTNNAVRCDDPCDPNPCADPNNPVCSAACGTTLGYTCGKCGSGTGVDCSTNGAKPNTTGNQLTCACTCGSSQASCTGSTQCCLPNSGNTDFNCDSPCGPAPCNSLAKNPAFPANRNCQVTCGTYAAPDPDGFTCSTFCTDPVKGGCTNTYGSQTSCAETATAAQCVCGSDVCGGSDCCYGNDCHDPCSNNPCTDPSKPVCTTNNESNNRIGCNNSGTDGGVGYRCYAASCPTNCQNPNCNITTSKAYCTPSEGQCTSTQKCVNNACVDVCVIGGANPTCTGTTSQCTVNTTTCGATCTDPCLNRTCTTIACAVSQVATNNTCAYSSSGRALTCNRVGNGYTCSCQSAPSGELVGGTGNTAGYCGTNGNTVTCCDDRGTQGSAYTPTADGCYNPCDGNPCAGRGDSLTRCNVSCNQAGTGNLSGSGLSQQAIFRNYTCSNPCNGNTCDFNLSPSCVAAADGGTNVTNVVKGTNYTCGCGTDSACTGSANCCVDSSGTAGTTTGYNLSDRTSCDPNADVCNPNPCVGIGICVRDCSRVGGYVCNPTCTSASCNTQLNPTCNPTDTDGNPCSCNGTDCSGGCCDTVGTGSLHCHNPCPGTPGDGTNPCASGELCQPSCGVAPGYTCVNGCGGSNPCSSNFQRPDCASVGGTAVCSCNGNTNCTGSTACCVDGADKDGVRDECNGNPCSGNPCASAAGNTAYPAKQKCTVECNSADADKNGYRCDDFCTGVTCTPGASAGFYCNPANGNCACGATYGSCSVAGTSGATQICCGSGAQANWACRGPATCANSGGTSYCNATYGKTGCSCDPCGAGDGCSCSE